MWRKARAQPKDAFEQPVIIQSEQVKSDERALPISLFTGEPYDPEWFGEFVRAPKADPSIISKVWK